MRFKVLVFLLTFRRFWELITGIVIESEHVLTICDGNSISHTRKGETIPQCPELPSPEGFFDAPRRILYEEKCKNDDSSFVRDSNGETRVIQYGILALKWLIDGLRHQLNQLIDTLLRFVADDLLGFNSIAKNWSTQWHIILICVFAVLFHLKDGSRIKKLWKSSLLGLVSSSVLLFVYSYYQNIWSTLVFLLMAISAMSPCWPVAFRGLGTLTILQLFLPLLGTILKLFLNIQLFLGPILNCFINGASILIHIICLIGLFMDEKLMILKVLLLPLYQTFTNLFIHNDKHSALLDSIRKSVEELSSGLMGGVATGRDGQQLEGSFHNQLRRLCENTTLSWYATCPTLFARSCKDFADRTVPAQADQALQTAGQWLTDALLTPIKQQNSGTVQRSASKTICQKMSDSVCRIVDLSSYCKPDETFYGSAYDFFNNALEKLKNIILIQPWVKLKSIFRIPEESKFGSGDLLNFDIIPILYRFLRICLALLALVLLLRALVQAFLFLRRYRRDPSAFRNYKIDWMRCSIKSGMLIRVIIWFLIEEVFQSLHEKLQNIRFRVPEKGDARFAFNVQGNGTIAVILSSVLGGFDLQSRYCTVADTAVCSTLFFPLGWKSWTALFTLGSLYTFTDILARHADYWMSFLCSRFFFRKSTEIIISKLKIEKRRKRVENVEQWTEKTLESSDPEENKRLLTFFHRYRSFCRLRFTPTLFLSLIAHYRFRIIDIHCQICLQHLITTQFRDCHSLLFCNECSSCLKRCPCCHRQRRVQVE